MRARHACTYSSGRTRGAAPSADRHRVPVLVGRARRRAAAHQGPGRGADRARPRGLGDRPRRRGPAAAAVRGPGGQGDAGAVQRLGGPARVRPAVDAPGPPLAARRRLRRAARARALRAVAVAARLLGGVRADRGDRAHRDAQVPGAARHPAGAPHRAGEDRRPDRGLRGGPVDVRRAPGRRRGADPQRGRHPPLPARATRSTAGRARAARSASSAGWTSRARAWRCCCARSSCSRPAGPGLRLLIAGHGDVDEQRRSLPAELRDRAVFLGEVSEEDKVRVLHSVDVFCSPNTGGESFGIVTAEAMAAGAADRRVRHPGVPRRAARRPGGRAVRHRRRRRPGPGRPPGCSTTRPAAPSCRSPPSTRWPTTTGAPSRRNVLSVYETVVLGRTTVGIAQ